MMSEKNNGAAGYEIASNEKRRFMVYRFVIDEKNRKRFVDAGRSFATREEAISFGDQWLQDRQDGKPEIPSVFGGSLMTIDAALSIQYEQIDWYSQTWSRQDLAEAMGLMTDTMALGTYDHQRQISVVEINKMVPRGGDFERLWQNPSAARRD